MRTNLALFAVTVGAVFGQSADVSRLFVFHHVEKAQDLQQVATLIRMVAGVPDVTVDAIQKTMSLRGSLAQMQVAEWLFTELDRLTLPEFATKEFRVANNDADVVRVFFLHNTPAGQSFQELATTIRTVVEIRRMFASDARNVLAVRGSAEQIAATEFVVRELDQPAGAKRVNSPIYLMPDIDMRGAGGLRVFYLPYASTELAFSEAMTLLRTIGEIRCLFAQNASKAIIMVGTTNQLAVADWIIQELGKPATAFASQVFTYPNFDRDAENMVRVFYLNGAPSRTDVFQVEERIRMAAKVRRVYSYFPTHAIVVRGSQTQLAKVEQVLTDRALAAK